MKPPSHVMTATDVPDRGVTLRRDDSGRYHVSYDYVSQKEIGVVVVLAVSAIEGVGALELPPLSETLDLDALDAFVHDPGEGETTVVHFEYAGNIVRVADTGAIRLTPAGERRNDPV